MNNSFEFSGFEDIAVKDTEGNKNSIDNQADRLVDDLKDMAKFTKEGEPLCGRYN